MTSFFQFIESLSIEGFRGKLEDDIFFILPFILNLTLRAVLDIVLINLIILKMRSFFKVAKPLSIKGFRGK